MVFIEKIEEIRKKPDHIKMRYVWICVIACMILIVFIWFLSIKAGINEASLKQTRTDQDLEEIKQSGSDLLREIEKQKIEFQETRPNATLDQSN